MTSVISLQWGFYLLVSPVIYWLVPERLRSPVLVAICASFLALVSPVTLPLLTFATLVAFGTARKFAGNGRMIALGCALQLLPLIGWRLVPFETAAPLPDWAIPVGLAFFALRGVHYLVEAYRGALPAHGLGDTFDYFFFLPTIIAGPIHRFPQFLTDSRRRRWNREYFSRGLERILFGYAKIAIIANELVNDWMVNWAGHLAAPGSRLDLYFTMFIKGLNGYFQFAGYSDVAIGFALLLGFRVMENFNAPLTRPNVQQFWGAWHISLTSWCRDYVYTPTFSLTRMRGVGILTSMAVLGLWHEFTFRYLAWGLYNGALIVLWHRWRRLAGERLDAGLEQRPLAARLWYGVSVILTLHAIFLGFVLVQHPTLSEGLATIGRILGLAG